MTSLAASQIYIMKPKYMKINSPATPINKVIPKHMKKVTKTSTNCLLFNAYNLICTDL